MIHECPNCGMEMSGSVASAACPKCDSAVREVFLEDLYVVDVAHGGESWDVAERKIEAACSAAIFGRHKGLKVIHGYGSGRGHTAEIKTRAVPLLNRLARRYGGRIVPDKRNPGAHLLYFN